MKTLRRVFLPQIALRGGRFSFALFLRMPKKRYSPQGEISAQHGKNAG
jgi:hypothetical protein